MNGGHIGHFQNMLTEVRRATRDTGDIGVKAAALPTKARRATTENFILICQGQQSRKLDRKRQNFNKTTPISSMLWLQKNTIPTRDFCIILARQPNCYGR